MPKALVIIDMQKNFIREIGAEGIVPAVAAKIRQRAEEGYEIILTLDKSGGALDEEVASGCGGAKIFKKHSYGCEELVSYLKESAPDAVEFVGVCTDICVITNVLATITVLPFVEIAVDGGCCAAENSVGHNCALKVMKACNVEVL